MHRPRLVIRPQRYVVHSVAVLVVLALIVAGWGSAVPVGALRLVSGAIWLPSRIGQVSLLSGLSGKPLAAVEVAPSGHDLVVVQSGPDGYVVDRTDGTVRLVSGATFDAGQAVHFADDGRQLQVFANGSHVVVLDGARGLAYRVDPTTLQAVRPAVTLSASVRRDTAMLDDAGRLWAIDAGTGDLTWLDDTVHRRAQVVPPRTGHLVAVDGAPVLVGPASAHWLGSDGTEQQAVDLGISAGDRLEVSGTDSGQLLIVAPGRGLLDVCRRDGCGQAYPLVAGHDLGAAVHYEGLFIVPDYTTGSVTLLSPGTPGNSTVSRLLAPSAVFDLTSRDTVLFYNDRASNRSGVVRLEGPPLAIQKYDAQHPTAGLDVGASKTKPRRPIKPTPVPTRPSRAAPHQPHSAPTSSAGTGGPNGTPASPSNPPASPTEPPASPASPPASPTGPPPSPFAISRVLLTPNPATPGTAVSIAVSVTSGTMSSSCTWTIGTQRGPASCSAPLTAPAPGNYTVAVDGHSTDGQPAKSSDAVLTVKPDVVVAPPLSPPAVAVPAQCVGTSETATLTASDSMPVESWTWTVDGVTHSPVGSASYTFQSTQLGPHQVSVTAARGSQSASSSSASFTVCDKSPPTGQVLVDGGKGSTYVNVRLTGLSHAAVTTLHVEISIRSGCTRTVGARSPLNLTGSGTSDLETGRIGPGTCFEPAHWEQPPCPLDPRNKPHCTWLPARTRDNVIAGLTFVATMSNDVGCKTTTAAYPAAWISCSPIGSMNQ